MSQRVVVGFVAVMLVAASSFAVSSNCVGIGKATVSIPGDPNAKVAQTDILFSDNTTTAGVAMVTAANGTTDPFPASIAIWFSSLADCNAKGSQFPDQGGVFIGTTKVDDKGNFYHMVAGGHYCEVSDVGGDPKAPLAPRNIIEIAAATNKCGRYIGFADIQTLDVVYDASNKPLVNKVAATFTVHCVDPTNPGPAPVTGTVSYTANPTNKGSSKPKGSTATLGTAPPCLPGEDGSSDTGGGSGGTPGPTAPPTNVSFVVPDSISATAAPIVINPSQSNTFEIQTATANGFAGDVNLDVVSDASDTDLFNVSISPQLVASPGSGKATLTISTRALTFPRDYNVTLIATTPSDGAIYTYTFPVTVPCDPPKILGTQQPQNATVRSNAKASLNVTSSGSGPFTYQWYTGIPGMTDFPVKDATGATFTTDQDGTYWVRVTNACGTVDSEAATVSH